MIKPILSILISFIYIGAIAQSADLDKENFKVSYVKLPSKPILDDSKRTYSTNSGAITISGFSKVKENGTLDINYNFHGTKIGEVDIKKIKNEKKDKDGNVISTTYAYHVVVHYASTASLTINNAETAESDTRSFSKDQTYKSKTFYSYSKAQDYYNNNRTSLRNEHRSKHKKSFAASAKEYLNSTYGYVPYTNKYEYFWILGSTKHPEYQKHHEAYEKLKIAFEKIAHDQPVDEIKAEVQPVIDYFNSVIPNYQGTKRKMRKVRYASYYNIAKIYYYLDMPEKAKEYAQKIIDNDYNKGDGKYFIRISDNLLRLFEANKVNTSHMKVFTEDLSNVPDEKEEATPSGDIEINKAYLITKENDTILVDIKTEDLAKIAYDMKTVEYDNNGRPFGTRVRKAKKCKELLFVNGLHYRNIAFKESSVTGGDIDAGQMLLGSASDKLCKVLYESDKINLYLFNDTEPVFLLPGNKKGKSTLSAKFIFGFKKSLANIAEGCPSLQEKAKNKEYENTVDSLIAFCKELTACSSERSGN